MIVGIEGPDLAGKSYLWKIMRDSGEFPDWNFVSLGGISKDLHEHMDELSNYLSKFLLQLLSSRENYVFDRFIVSDFVYGSLYDRKVSAESFALLKKAFYIYLNYDFNRKIFPCRDTIYSLKNVYDISNAYKTFFNYFPTALKYSPKKILYLDCTGFRKFENDLFLIKKKMNEWSKINEP